MIDVIRKTNATKRGRRTMIYGVHGVGKSTAANCAPKPVFIPTEDGLQDMEADAFPLCNTFEEVLEALRLLEEEDHDYKTVCIDSLDWTERLVWEKTARIHEKDSIDSWDFYKGYSLCLKQWNEILTPLQRLSEGGMNVVLIAHCKTERFDNPQTDAYDRFVPRLHKNASALVQEWCDEVLFAAFKVYTRKTGKGFNETTKGVGKDERLFHTTEKPSHQAKNRLGMPEEIQLSFAEYWQYVDGSKMNKTQQELADHF